MYDIHTYVYTETHTKRGIGKLLEVIHVFIILILMMVSQLRAYVQRLQVVHIKHVHFLYSYIPIKLIKVCQGVN